MAVAGNFSAVVEIVEHAELPGELVLVRSDVGAIDGERRVAVADLQIAEDLIKGAVLFDDVDDVLDGIVAAGELDRSGIVVQQVVMLDGAGEFLELAESRWNVQLCDGAAEQGRNVGMTVVLDLICGLAHGFVRAGALAFGGGDEQVVALNGQGAGVPVGGDETESEQPDRAVNVRQNV